MRPAKTQISLGIRPVWSESSLWPQWVAKDPSFLHADSEDSDQTGWMPRLIWVFAERTCHFVGFDMRRLISKKNTHTHTHTHIINCRSIARQELVRPSEEYVSGLMKELLFRQWKRNRKAMTSVLLQLAVFATKITLMHYFCIHVCNGQTLSRQRLAIERSRQHVMDHSNNDIKTSQTSWHFLTWC